MSEEEEAFIGVDEGLHGGPFVVVGVVGGEAVYVFAETGCFDGAKEVGETVVVDFKFQY